MDPQLLPQVTALLATLPDPAAGSLIKTERRTLIWHQDTGAGHRAVLKMYRHRGPIAFLRERHTRYVVQREFEALDHLRKWGIPCSEPIGWAHGYSTEQGRFEILATREVAGADSLRSLADRTQAEGIPWDLAPLFRSVRRMHESGMFHGALHLRNILVARDAEGLAAFHVIDTPRALLYPGSIASTRMALFDLLLLASEAVKHLGIPGPNLPIQAYGLRDRPLQAFLRQLPGFQPTRFDRQRIRVEASLRLAHARFGRSRMRSLYREVTPGPDR
jgi:hypothetical protein